MINYSKLKRSSPSSLPASILFIIDAKVKFARHLIVLRIEYEIALRLTALHAATLLHAPDI